MEIKTISPVQKMVMLPLDLPGYDDFFAAHIITGERSAIIDVGPGAGVHNLLAALEELKLRPESVAYIILTHIHIDHAGGAGAAVRQLPRAKVVVHPRAREHVIEPSRLRAASLKTLGEVALKYGDIEPVPAGRVISAEDGMKLDLGKGVMLEVYLTPGHAAHHLSVYDPGRRVLLAGEAGGTCVRDNIRPSTPPPFRRDDTLASMEKLISLKPEVICYGHLGCYPDAVARLKTSHRMLLDWLAWVEEAAREEKSLDEVMEMLRERDRRLDYLKGFDPDVYKREYLFLRNSIEGIYNSLKT